MLPASADSTAKGPRKSFRGPFVLILRLGFRGGAWMTASRVSVGSSRSSLYRPPFQGQTQCHIEPTQKSRSNVGWNGLGQEPCDGTGDPRRFHHRPGLPLQAALKRRSRISGRCASGRTVHAPMLTPVLMHLFPARFHSCEALLERRADRGLLLVVQRVIEVQPRGARLVAQLGILLFDFLMCRVHGVQIENGLLLH